jgi:hypothetical protein
MAWYLVKQWIRLDSVVLIEVRDRSRWRGA